MGSITLASRFNRSSKMIVIGYFTTKSSLSQKLDNFSGCAPALKFLLLFGLKIVVPYRDRMVAKDTRQHSNPPAAATM